MVWRAAPGASLNSGLGPSTAFQSGTGTRLLTLLGARVRPPPKTALGRVILGSRGFRAQGDLGRTKGLELKVTLNEAMSERLRDIAKARGLDPNEVLERAVALYGYALDKAEPNGPFLQVKENGQDKKVAL